ncbi:galactoside 2-alpha-L-fucosyltransferase [Musa acuminata AAA Group]|uniref:galactoside 2-alpha-L-fucosyltransferase n=1 Tax=Musa acuminata AAA Group TaxID=214697 RepID=UPI0031CDC5FE
MRDKLLGAAAGRPLLVVAALTIVLLLIFLSGATRNLPLDLLTRSYSAPEEGPQNCSSASPIEPAKDKLLGGLLSPAFDEPSCLSRYQSALFWKSSNHTPSPFLLQKLRSYEALHKRCGPHTDLYNKSIEQLRSNRSTGPLECNYVVWLQSGGLGNRLMSLISTFLYAILNNRVLLLSVPDDLHDMFCEPFPGTSWALPWDFPIKKLETHDFYRGSPQSYGNLLKNKVLSNGMNTTLASLPAYLYLHLMHDADDSDKMFYCEDAQPLFQSFPWLFLRSNQYFAPSLFLMSQYNDELQKLFPEKETVFHHLGRYLVHPANSVWGYVTRYYEAYLANAKERVGIQVRNFPNAPVKLELMLDQVVNCTLKEKILPDIEVEVPANLTTSGVKPKAVLVTSLQTGYFEKLRNMYYEHSSTTGDAIGVYQPSHEELQRTENQNHNTKALAEMYLLSFSDVLVTTAFSTFGYVAQGLGGLRPWMVLRPDNQNPPCRRALSMEPCFHFASAYDCKAGRNIDKGTVVPHVKHCEDLDFRWGLKLFD